MLTLSRHRRFIVSNGSVGHRIWSSLPLACAVTACDAPERASGIEPALSVSSTPAALLPAFIAAQGTYCNDAAWLCCDSFAIYDVGWISSMCSPDCATFMTVDIGGVNRRWWTRRGLPEFAPYASRGTISDSRTADGRRRLVLNVRAENTFVAFENAAFEAIVGADFLEYPTVSPTPATPRVGTVTMQAEMILPAGFVGMPDIAQAVFDPPSGIELLRMNVTTEVDGPLRIAHAGLPVGMMVRVSGTQRWQPRLAAMAVPSRHLIQLAYDATSRISVRQLR